MTHQKMRPLPTASRHPKEIVADILREHLDDPAEAVPGAVDEIFSALGIDVLAVDQNVDHRTYRDLQSEDRTVEYVKEKLTRGVAQYLADTGTIGVARTRDKGRGFALFRASLWVLRTPEGPAYG